MLPVLFSLYQYISCPAIICQKYLDSSASLERIVAVAQPVVYQSPITITKGGTYSGNWQSLDPDVPAVTIKTSEPVIIENSRLRGRGDLIKAPNTVNHIKLTVRNTYGYGLNSNKYGREQGRFLSADLIDNIVVENCYINNTSGIYLFGYEGNGSASHSVRIRYNKARNIDGRKSDGKGGFINEFGWSQFVQLNQVRHVPGVEIAWNEVINEPYKSRVEDNINIHLSSGRSSSPILIHNNYIQGGYPANPAKDEYTGGGIMLGDGSSETVAGATAFVRAYNNQVVNIAGHGISVAAGHNIQFYNNRVISNGVLPDGTAFSSGNLGSYIWDLYGDKPKGTFYNNYGYNNTFGCMRANGDVAASWFPDCASGKCTNNKTLPNPITSDTEKAEFKSWLNKVASKKVKIGPNF